MTAPRVLLAVDEEFANEVRAWMRHIDARLDAAKLVPAPEWVDRATACKRLGVSSRTLDRRARDGEIKTRGAGKSRRFKVEW